MKVMLILVDGMRPDALKDCSLAQEIIAKGTYTMQGTTVMPSVTLPCHMSLFHSVDPYRHGTTTNIHMPQVRPIDGLSDVLAKYGKTCAHFYNWEQLRDLSRPGSLVCSYFCKGSLLGWEKANDLVAKEAAAFVKEYDPDFAFVYMGYVDEAGHKYGWLSQEYYAAIENSWNHIADLFEQFGEEYTVIITADHGGHERMHGTDLKEDMTIPVILIGENFEAGKELASANIKDLAPTIAKLMGVEPDKDWEGKALYED